MSGFREIELPDLNSCQQCDDNGYITLRNYNQESAILFAKAIGSYLIHDLAYKVHCTKCEGTGKNPNQLELEIKCLKN